MPKVNNLLIVKHEATQSAICQIGTIPHLASRPVVLSAGWAVVDPGSHCVDPVHPPPTQKLALPSLPEPPVDLFRSCPSSLRRDDELLHPTACLPQGRPPRRQVARSRNRPPGGHVRPDIESGHHRGRHPPPTPLDGAQPDDGSRPAARSSPRVVGWEGHDLTESLQAEIHARAKGQVFLGLYVANEGVEDTTVPPTTVSVAEAIRKEFTEAIVLVVSGLLSCVPMDAGKADARSSVGQLEARDDFLRPDCASTHYF